MRGAKMLMTKSSTKSCSRPLSTSPPNTTAKGLPRRCAQRPRASRSHESPLDSASQDHTTSQRRKRKGTRFIRAFSGKGHVAPSLAVAFGHIRSSSARMQTSKPTVRTVSCSIHQQLRIEGNKRWSGGRERPRVIRASTHSPAGTRGRVSFLSHV